MFSEVDVFNLSGIYDDQSFYRNDKSSVFDMRGIPGTNCMCDDEALARVKEIMTKGEVSYNGIHFIDSGNYHYMSKILTDMVKEPFSLVVLDHHPDMQPPMFGDILSCGGWVLKVMEENPYVRDVHVIGADRGLIEQIEEIIPQGRRVVFYDVDEVFAGGKVLVPDAEHPVYLSIDKDVLSRDVVTTNWDQGDMTREQMISFVREILPGTIGIDICGECAPDQEDCDIAAALACNDDFNREILEIIKRA